MKGLIFLSLAVAAGPVAAQDLASRIAASHADRVTFTFPAKDGVCGDGESINFGEVQYNWGRSQPCRHGPVRITADLNAGRVLRLKTTVGDDAPSGATDLGEVTAAAGADWLLDLAAAGQGRASEEALMPAVLARDVVVWPRLVTMAKDHSLRDETRKQAIFWLGQQAADEAVGPLSDVLDDDPDVQMKEAALFALTQQHTERAMQVLLRTARSHPDKQVRRQAFFWLGQSEDPRGIALFEEVLAGR